LPLPGIEPRYLEQGTTSYFIIHSCPFNLRCISSVVKAVVKRSKTQLPAQNNFVLFIVSHKTLERPGHLKCFFCSDVFKDMPEFNLNSCATFEISASGVLCRPSEVGTALYSLHGALPEGCHLLLLYTYTVYKSECVSVCLYVQD
jgi:hypothetical protein